MKISMINIIVSAFVLSVTAGLFYLNRQVQNSFEGTDGMGKSPAPIDKLLEVSVASIW